MKIGIIGMGLMGGSMAKAIKARTPHQCYGYNRTKATLEKAMQVLDGELNTSNMKEMDIVFVCLMPQVTIDFVIKNIANLKKRAIVVDICGVKEYIIDNLERELLNKGIYFIGGHPMAGKEVGGYDNSKKDLFNTASFILTPTEKTPQEMVERVETLAKEMGFARIVKTTAQTHDEIIAYTSQLAHIVSNAYVKSPNLKRHKGFSAGSFQDLTRVARLDSKMWTELFLLNKKPLLNELDNILNNLQKYKTALTNEDGELLQKLLEEGNKLKIESLNLN